MKEEIQKPIIKKISFELTWNDINAAIANYVKDKAEAVLDKETDIPLQTFIAFCDNEGKQLNVESATIIVKSI